MNLSDHQFLKMNPVHNSRGQTVAIRFELKDKLQNRSGLLTIQLKVYDRLLDCPKDNQAAAFRQWLSELKTGII